MMDLTSILAQLVQTKNTHRNALVALDPIIDAHVEASRQLAESKANIIVNFAGDPKSLGGNEAARNARIDEMTAPLARALAESEIALRRGRTAVTVTGLDWTLARDLAAFAKVAPD